MAGDDTIAYASAVSLTELYRKRSLSPVEATRLLFERLDALQAKLNAFCVVDRDGALAAAHASEERWRRGEPIGPLDGVPATIKDLMLTRGFPTLRGSHLVDRDQDWPEDTPAVARLREAGTVILGKTTTPEFGWKALGDSRSPASPAIRGICRAPRAAAAPAPRRRRPPDRGVASRQRWCGIDPHAIVLLRHLRAEAELWPGAGLSAVAAGTFVASRTDSANRRRCGDDADRHRAPDHRDPYALPATTAIGMPGSMAGSRAGASPSARVSATRGRSRSRLGGRGCGPAIRGFGRRRRAGRSDFRFAA